MYTPIRVLYWGMTENIGGIESFIMNVYRNIDRSKIQIDFLLNHNAGKIAFEDEITEMGGRLYRVMYSERESFFKARSSLKKFFKEHKEFKAVHIHANFPYVFPLKYARKYGVPIRILHSHNSNGNTNKNWGIKKIISFVRDIQIKNQINTLPTCYFACSDLAADYMFPEKEYVWVKNGIDLKKYDFNQSVKDEVLLELNIDKEYQVLGFVGRLREQKNPFFIIDIFREYLKLNTKTKLIIVGVGEYEKELKKYSEDLIFNGDVIFLGKRIDTERLYQAMDAFLLPSIYEGLPVVLVEAQTAGLPSFTSDIVTKQVNVTDLIEYYSLKDNANSWAMKIYDKLKSTKRRGRLADIESQGFDIKSVAKEIEEFYLQ